MMIGRGCPGPLSSRRSSICTSGPNGDLVARQHRTARIADYPIWVDQYEEIARHTPSTCARRPEKTKSPDRTAKLARLKLTILRWASWLAHHPPAWHVCRAAVKASRRPCWDGLAVHGPCVVPYIGNRSAPCVFAALTSVVHKRHAAACNNEHNRREDDQ